MQPNVSELSTADRGVEITLDGQPLAVPPERQTATAIRSYLEAVALAQQRILCSFTVDSAAETSASRPKRVTAQTLRLEQVPLLLVETALQQTAQAHRDAQHAVAQVIINEPAASRELWWTLARDLKQPLLTLSLLPEAIYSPPAGGASLKQLRGWQLQQLACIIRDTDEAAGGDDSLKLSEALETRVLPWLEALQDSLDLLRSTLLTAPQRQVSSP